MVFVAGLAGFANFTVRIPRAFSVLYPLLTTLAAQNIFLSGLVGCCLLLGACLPYTNEARLFP
jgi:hypothetical protein